MTETTVRAPAPPGLLYAMAEQQRRRLDDADAAALHQMNQRLAVAQARITADLDQVTDLIATRRAAGLPVSPAWLYRQDRAKALLATVQQEVGAYADVAARETTILHKTATGLGARDATSSGSQAAGVSAGSFTQVNPANLSAVAGFLADGTPVANLFAAYGPAAQEAAAGVLTSAVAAGWGADKTARAFQDQVIGLSRHRAETVARTELHRVYRSTSRDTYHANADVVTGWYWRATLSKRTCPACLAQDGTFHTTDETLDGHPRCRCAMIPATRPLPGMDATAVQAHRRGADWLAEQSPTEQDAILGKAKGRLYREGQIGLEDTVVRTSDPRWGTMRREATIAEARGAAAARGVPQRIAKTTPTPAGGTRRKTATEARAEADTIRRSVPAATPAPEPATSPNLMGRDDLQRRLDASGGTSGLTRHAETLGGTQGEVYAASMADGTPVIVRQARNAEHADSEVLSEAIAEHLHAPVPAVVRTTDGTVQVRLDGVPIAAEGTVFTEAEEALFARVARDQPERVRRLGLLDVAIGNPDRHLGNLVIGTDGQVYGIDHAFRMSRRIGPGGPGLGVPAGEATDVFASAPITLGEARQIADAVEAVRGVAESLGRLAEWEVLRAKALHRVTYLSR